MEVDRSSLGVPLSAAFGDAPAPGLGAAAGGSAPPHHTAQCPSCGTDSQQCDCAAVRGVRLLTAPGDSAAVGSGGTGRGGMDWGTESTAGSRVVLRTSAWSCSSAPCTLSKGWEAHSKHELVVAVLLQGQSRAEPTPLGMLCPGLGGFMGSNMVPLHFPANCHPVNLKWGKSLLRELQKHQWRASLPSPGGHGQLLAAGCCSSSPGEHGV